MPWHTSFPTQISCCTGDLPRTLSSHILRGMRRCWEILGQPGFSCNIALENYPRRGGIWPNMVWAHPYQVHLSYVDVMANKLALVVNSGDNWAFTFVWLNEDAQHVPLPKEGHLSTMIGGVPSRNVCRCLYQLEVHWLLQCENWLVYPEGLNGACSQC